MQLAEDEGYRVITDDGPPMRFSLHDPAYRQTHVDSESSTGRAGKDVRGIPMDEPAYHNLLAILERVMDTPEMMADEKLMYRVNQFLALVMAAAPRRVLARHHGFAEISLGAARELDWEDIESWIAEQPPEEEAAERQFLLEPGQAVDSQVLATLHRACEDHSLLRVELKKAAPVVLEARKIGYSWTTERQLQGFDQASGQELKLGF
ncbi:hypothetical protein COCCU_10270 [Corynebacterium occultum]|uniref:Uncharacterized protein n=1 Tax=Corynebacterium occultum TaxID=2675219 RepID=A0A6B8VUW2_9CORY|nr:hypothetical protein [Corynebacterium occultum]QGU07973.1 hypothetical protein COCCU_10270 [Corynebacterium occultum]